MGSFGSQPQWLASQGWVVFEPNYRGSSNGGNAFQSAIWNDAGAGPGRDVWQAWTSLSSAGSPTRRRWRCQGGPMGAT